MSDSVALVQSSQAPAPFSLFNTAMKMEEAREQHGLLRQYVASLLVEGVDYGKIPGAGDKSVLHKPGAEHLCQLFRLRPDFISLNVIEDFEKGLAFYRYDCHLIHIPSGQVVGSGIGSCSSYESKYRWRQGSRKCPVCGLETIIKGKEEFGGGFLCYGKKGGCGAKFTANDPAIVNQETGKVLNENIIDSFNTVDKMAQKRALIAATLITCGCSEYFTQDLEDFVDTRTGEVVSVKPEPAPKPKAKDPRPAVPTKEAAPKVVTSTSIETNDQPPKNVAESTGNAPAPGTAGLDLPFDTLEKGKAEIFALVNKILDLRDPDHNTAPKVLSVMFAKPYTPQALAAEKDFEAVKGAYTEGKMLFYDLQR